MRDKPKRKKKAGGKENGDALHVEVDSASGSLDIPLDDPALEKKSPDTERKLKNHSVFQSKLNILTYKIGLLGFVCATGTAVIIIIRFCINNYGVLKNSWSSDDLTTILDSVIVGITILGIPTDHNHQSHRKQTTTIQTIANRPQPSKATANRPQGSKATANRP